MALIHQKEFLGKSEMQILINDIHQNKIGLMTGSRRLQFSGLSDLQICFSVHPTTLLLIHTSLVQSSAGPFINP